VVTLITSMGLMGAAAVTHADVIYNINTTATSSNPTGNPLQTDTVLGTITTNGKLGILAASDILGWNLNLIDGLNSANNFNLSPSNSELVHDWGNALSATTTGLIFDYSISGAEFLIQGNVIHPISSGYNYFCFSATGGWCLAGETISPQYVFTDGVVVTGAAAPVGQQPLDQGPRNSVPEPTSFGLVFIGLLSLAGIMKRKLFS
jgi:hypothetical protein